jgi:hypothetical protein
MAIFQFIGVFTLLAFFMGLSYAFQWPRGFWRKRK